MKRRWIIPDPEFKGHLKLVVEEPMPLDAICEAPHNFTTDMEPYLYINEILEPGKMPVKVPKWKPEYLTDLRQGTLKKKENKEVRPDHTAKAAIEEAKVRKVEKVAEIHNRLRPFQRYAYNFLGPNTSMSPWFKVIFKDKLTIDGAAVGVKINV